MTHSRDLERVKRPLHMDPAAMARCRMNEIVEDWKELEKDSLNVEQEELELTSTYEEMKLMIHHDDAQLSCPVIWGKG